MQAKHGLLEHALVSDTLAELTAVEAFIPEVAEGGKLAPALQVIEQSLCTLLRRSILLPRFIIALLDTEEFLSKGQA